MSARWYETRLAPVVLALSGCFDPAATSLEPVPVVDPSTGMESSGDAETETSGSAPDPQTSEGGMEPDGETEPDAETTTPDDETTTTSEPSSDTEPVGPPACAYGNGLCVATPADWLGPVRPLAVDHGSAADCGGAEIAVSASADLDAPAAVCSCECGDASGASCSDAMLTAWGNDGTCSDDAAFSQLLDSPSCNFIPGGDSEGEPPVETFNYWSVTTESSGGSCQASASRSVPPLAYQTDMHGCGVAPLDMECESGGQCFEAPDEGPLCVWREGDHECPGEGFSVRSLYHRGAPNDTRDCSSCSCGTPEGSCPSTTVEMFIGHYCSSGSEVGTIGVCTGLCAGPGCETYALSAVLDLGPAEASCDPSGGAAVGGVVETDPVTFCCSE